MCRLTWCNNCRWKSLHPSAVPGPSHSHRVPPQFDAPCWGWCSPLKRQVWTLQDQLPQKHMQRSLGPSIRRRTSNFKIKHMSKLNWLKNMCGTWKHFTKSNMLLLAASCRFSKTSPPRNCPNPAAPATEICQSTWTVEYLRVATWELHCVVHVHDIIWWNFSQNHSQGQCSWFHHWSSQPAATSWAQHPWLVVPTPSRRTRPSEVVYDHRKLRYG